MKRATAIIFRSIILILVGITLGLLVNNNNFDGKQLSNPFSKNEKISKILQLVKNNYVDTVNIAHIEDDAINNMLQNLDPHSIYLPPQQAQSVNERLEGGFNGIGIEYQLLRDTLYIVQVYRNGPAARAGMVAGQKIISVNHKPFSGTSLTVSKVKSIFRGQKNTAILLGVTGKGLNGVRNYTITRGHVTLSSVDAAYMANLHTGYIKLGKFAATTDNDFKTALQQLKNRGLESLVIDLRGNGGGYLNAATALADEFLPKGKLIVYTQGEHEPRTDYFATDSGMFQKGDIAVLIDEYSASASEIVAGCLQDLDRAIIIGRRSFGKGLVQEQFPFADGSAVNLTVARYYTPSGRCIQKSYKNGLDSYRNEIATRLQKGELFSAENTLKDSVFTIKSNFHTRKGKKVFSGGGIMPDVFIPADSAANTMLMQELGAQQLFTAFVIDKLYSKLDKYHGADDFIKNYKVSDNEFENFIVYASGTLKEMDSAEIARSKNDICKYLKAYAARLKWGNATYYRVLNITDPAVAKAVELLAAE